MPTDIDPSPGETVHLHDTWGTGPDTSSIAISDRAIYVSRATFALLDRWYMQRIPHAHVRAIAAVPLKSTGPKVFTAVLFVAFAAILVFVLDGANVRGGLVAVLSWLVMTGITLPLALAERHGLRIELVDGTLWWRPIGLDARSRQQIRMRLRRIIDAARKAGIATSVDFD
ncbi:MAG TPA: hypothetical protein VND91_11695 [Candidatus Saccharimonadia bacterium]|nr:hypothetical protein [Candidatus Saccharimonadia bacterium]